jgi:hypothetical protein
MKQCVRCIVEKPLHQFGDNKNNKDGKSIYCKECERLRGIEYRTKNRKKVNESSKNWRINNPEDYKKTIEKYLEKNPSMVSTERGKIYRKDINYQEKEKKRRKDHYQNNIETEREKNKKYYHENKKLVREKNNEWKNNKRKSDGFYRMKLNLRHRLRNYLFGESKSKRTHDIVGLDKLEFKSYVESKFTEGMSWENYGKWHLDHIKPLCQAKNNEEALLLNHYTNLQPLWAEDNLKKNRKYD